MHKIKVEKRSFSLSEMKKNGFTPVNIYSKSFNYLGQIRNEHINLSNLVQEIEIDGQNHRCIIKECQRHKVSKKVLHLDFQKVEGEKISYMVRVQLEKNDLCPGIKAGGVALFPKKVHVTCKSDKIIEKIYCDISALNRGDKIFSENLNLDGVTIRSGIPIVNIT